MTNQIDSSGENNRLIAHKQGNTHEKLETHLLLTAELAGTFGEELCLKKTAEMLGKVHDLGKASDDFQEYLWNVADGDHSHHGPDHSSAGAKYLSEHTQELCKFGELFAYVVAGHHGGLLDGTSLQKRLKKENIPEWSVQAKSHLSDDFFELDVSGIKKELVIFLRNIMKGNKPNGYSLGFMVRMLYSCLVDADFLATELFMNSQRAAIRKNPHVSMENLQEKLNAYYAKMRESLVSTGCQHSTVNTIRQEVLTDCLSAADLAGGLFTLTVPTGGGKTLASMAFALKHAIHWGKKRIIYVIPYTSIIDQTAKVFREVFGDDMVLEHHCQVDFDEFGASEQDVSRKKLLSENWDAPIIVTTSVQFFESLHSNRASRCRKLHNIANSVIVLDEAQTLPAQLLKPCLRCLDELMIHYRATVVLCTATQPAVFPSDNEYLRRLKTWNGLKGTDDGRREIISHGRNLHERLRRTVATRLDTPISDEVLAEMLVERGTALAIVSTRKHARELHEAVCRLSSSGKSVIHLSAQMCPAHRLKKLGEAKSCLKAGKSVIVIATQLIEAGVDVDFPCVFRQVAGVDSMVQAAGRCNREGSMDSPGEVFLFETSGAKPLIGELGMAEAIGKEVISLSEFRNDILSLEAVTRYFELLYAHVGKGSDPEHILDKHGVLESLMPINVMNSEECFTYMFSSLGENFKFIDNCAQTIFVPYDKEGQELCEAFRKSFDPAEQRIIARKLQRYAVSMYGSVPLDNHGGQYAEEIHGLWIMTSPKINYDDDYGISLQSVLQDSII